MGEEIHRNAALSAFVRTARTNIGTSGVAGPMLKGKISKFPIGKHRQLSVSLKTHPKPVIGNALQLRVARVKVGFACFTMCKDG